jgi:hypothetical protein
MPAKKKELVVVSEERQVYSGPTSSENKNPSAHAADLVRLGRDLVQAAKTLNLQEARFLVDLYYMMQENRKRAANQMAAMKGEPHATLEWFAMKAETMEAELRRSLESFAKAQAIGAYMLSNYAIGPVITAGLIAHIDIEKAPTAGHIWRFAGLDPTIVWGKGQKRPYNARLKTLCWKIGQSFLKNSGKEECFYGGLYRERKVYEIARNQSGAMQETARLILEKRKISPDTEAYAHLMGIAKAKASDDSNQPPPPPFPHLPPAQIDARARRWAVKIFLSHIQLVWYYQRYGILPPAPYPLAIQGHARLIVPPYFDGVPGLNEALAAGAWLYRTTPKLSS